MDLNELNVHDPISIERTTFDLAAHYQKAGMEKDESISRADEFVKEQIKLAKSESETPRITADEFDEKIAEQIEQKLKEAGLGKTEKKYGIYNDETAELNGSKELSDAERSKNFLRGLVSMKSNPSEAREKIASGQHGAKIDTVREKALAPMSEGTDADGGYLVPEYLEGKIHAIIEEKGLARKLATVMPVSTNSIKQSKRNAVLAATAVNEGAAISDDKATYSRVTHTIVKFGVIPVASTELLEDNIAFLEADIVAQAGEAFRKVEDDEFFESLAASSNGFTGMFNSPTENVMGSGDTAFSDLDYGDILTCIGGASDGEAAGAYWFMNRSVWYANVRSLLAAQNYLVNPGELMLEGHKVITSDSITSTSGVSTNFIAFGNPSHVVFADRKQLTLKVITEGTVDGVSLAETDQYGWKFRERFSIQNLFPAAFHTIKTAAS